LGLKLKNIQTIAQIKKIAPDLQHKFCDRRIYVRVFRGIIKSLPLLTIDKMWKIC
jgi:hypothetical protein